MSSAAVVSGALRLKTSKKLNFYLYSKACLKGPLKNRQNNGLIDKW